MAEREGNLGEVIDRRVQVYGSPEETFPRVAEIWSGITGHHINPCDVPLMMIGYKLLRANISPDYSDNIDDVEGYADIFRTVVGEDMIEARSVSEYIEKKWGPEVKTAVAPTPLEQTDLADERERLRLDDIDKSFCRSHGYHRAVARHTRAECPLPEVVG